MSDEPVAYLGGDQGGKRPPPDGEEVDGYLGGAADDEALPALPPQESHESYSARDFLDSEVQEQADPYADPYSDPYGAPAGEAAGYGDYEGYDAAASADTDPSYFESMAHGGTATDEAPPAEEYGADDYGQEDADQPKTISQQDAESIIRRITTKRILPPESATEKKPAVAPPPKLTEVGGGVRLWPIFLTLLIIAAMAVGFFGEQIAKEFPGLRPYMVWLPPEEVVAPPTIVEPIDPNEVARKKLLEMVVLSEAKAFGVQPKDVPPTAAKPAVAPVGGGQ
ncbi:MAG: hypothetical protein M9894_05345 [Planctomycetes bacterium]|nr:hypothetical protein [Planctomycetota bacterium]